MTAVLRPFARHDGREVREAVLESAEARISILSFGCVLRDWRVPMGGGAAARAATLGFERLEDYLAHSPSFGAVVGRVANRIAGGRFMLDGREVRLERNDGPNHLHGGSVGLGRRLWDIEADAAGTAVRLSRRSPDGEDGYPGAVDFAVVARLDGGRLTFEMEGRPDRPTPINLAQHSYWNLDGGGDVLGHELLLRADAFTPTDARGVPTGEILGVAGTDLDFRSPRRMVDATGAPLALDVNMALETGHDPAHRVAVLTGGRGDVALKLWTDQPGVQLYDAAALDVPAAGLDGRRYGPFAGVCLEAQKFPDAVNHANFPSIVCRPEQPYRQVTSVEILPIRAPA